MDRKSVSSIALRPLRSKRGIQPSIIQEKRDPWELNLGGEFSDEMLNVLRKTWADSDLDSNNAMSRDELQGFMDTLYLATGVPTPPDSVLRQEIITVFQSYDLDRNCLIEIPEMCYYLKYSHLGSQVSCKYRSYTAPNDDPDSGLLSNDDDKDLYESGEDIAEISNATKASVNLTVQGLKSETGSDTTVPSRLNLTMMPKPPTELLSLDFLTSVFCKKTTSVLSELATNLIFPDKVNPFAVFVHLGQTLKSEMKSAKPELELIVLTLLHSTGEVLDLLLGWPPPPPTATDSSCTEPPRAAKNQSLRVQLTSYLNLLAIEHAPSAKWIKTVMFLATLTRTVSLKSPVYLEASFEDPELGSQGYTLDAALPVNQSEQRKSKETRVKITSMSGFDCRNMKLNVLLPLGSIVTIEDIAGKLIVGKIKAVVSLNKGNLVFDRCVNEVEFCMMRLKMLTSIFRDQSILRAKKLFDTYFDVSSSGIVSREEFVSGLRRCGLTVEDDEGRAAFNLADVRKAETISTKGFLKTTFGKLGTTNPIFKRFREHSAEILASTTVKNQIVRPTRYIPPSLLKRKTSHKVRKLNIIPCEIEDGDVIELEPGTYKGTIVVTAQNVTIRGPPGEGKVIIHAATKESEAVVTLASRRSILENLTISNDGGGMGVSTSRIGYHDIINCTVRKTHGGILITGDANASISRCKVTDSKRFGIAFKGSSSGIIENSHLEKNSDGGIVLETPSKNWVSKCKLIQGKGCGIVVSGSPAIICDCTVSDNECSGIWVDGSTTRSPPILYSNTITNGRAAGVKIKKGSKAVLAENTLGNNHDHDLEIEGVAQVLSNTFTGGPGTAVFFAPNAKGFVEDNALSGYPLNCISISSRSSPTITNNTLVAPLCVDGKAFNLGQDASGYIHSNLVVGWRVDKGTGPITSAAQHTTVMLNNYIALTLDAARAARRRDFESYFQPSA